MLRRDFLTIWIDNSPLFNDYIRMLYRSKDLPMRDQCLNILRWATWAITPVIQLNDKRRNIYEIIALGQGDCDDYAILYKQSLIFLGYSTYKIHLLFGYSDNVPHLVCLLDEGYIMCNFFGLSKIKPYLKRFKPIKIDSNAEKIIINKPILAWATIE